MTENGDLRNTKTGKLPLPAGAGKMRRFMSLGGVSRAMIIESEDGKYYAYGNVAGAKIGSFTCAASDTVYELDIVLPLGRKILDVAGVYGSYSATYILILADDGTLWCAADPTNASVPNNIGFPTAGTNAAPTQFEAGKTFTRVAVASSCYSNYNSITAVRDNGELYGACGKNATLWDTGSRDNKWGVIANNAVDCAIGAYQSADWGYLATDGKFYKGSGSKSVSPFVAQAPAGVVWNSTGSTPGSSNSHQKTSFVIIPQE